MKLEGLTVNFLGDSITEGTGVINVAENRYDNRLKRMYNLGATNNYGIGGTRLAHQEKPSDKPRYDLCFCGRAYNMDPSADLIVVYGGVNDYILAVAVGKYLITAPYSLLCGYKASDIYQTTAV